MSGLEQILKMGKASKKKKAYLSKAELKAALRFEKEYRKSGLYQKVTMNWSRFEYGSLNTMKKSCPKENQFNHHLTYQKCSREAVQYLGPFLANILIDVFFFLKGFGQIEKERQLPQRSAKLLIKISLEQLSFFYGYRSYRQNETNTRSKSQSIRASV